MSSKQTHLTCPNCQCQLMPPSGAASGMNCPRCNTWLEIDPSCSGGCLSCHKMHQIDPSPCVETPEEDEKTGKFGFLERLKRRLIR